MDTITSTEFRKLYASLTKPVVVTVNGHPIGEWRPATYNPLAGLNKADIQALAKSRWDSEAEREAILHTVAGGSFNTHPFTPVPKPGSKR